MIRRRSMKRIVNSLLALAVLAVLVIATTTSNHTVRPVYAQSGCTDATLAGNYAFNGSGFTTPHKEKTGTEVPAAAAGVFTFDGAGNVSTVFTVSVNGGIEVGDTSSGTYTVNSDCTGTLSLTTGAVAGYDINFVMIGGGPEVFGVSTTPGVTQTLDLKKQ
jgi:hypothetical protein